MSDTILVVDDQFSVRQLLQEYLRGQGFQVATASDGQEALREARRQPPDLILLDLMMPVMDGFQFLRVFRQESQTPVIIISAREAEMDAVQGLELGADDYLVKPFSMRELLARVRAVLRRIAGGGRPLELRVGEITLNPTSHRVTAYGAPLSLTPIEFELLYILMSSPGQIFTRTQLIDHLQESGFNGEDRTLNVHVCNLRNKIEAGTPDPTCIETIFGVGYRLRRPN